ncbi:MAG: methyltransferase domain-containing protein, partial [Promethearchaeota archaeon]
MRDIKHILDLGTGTGIIAIFLQFIKVNNPNFNPKIFASDILEESIKCAQLNANVNNFDNKLNFINSDLFKSFPKYLKQLFDIVIFNPPYLPSLQKFTESNNKTRSGVSWDGGPKGIEVLMRFLCEVKDFVKKDAFIYFISSSKSDLTQLNENIKKLSFKNEILAKKHI